MTMTADVHDCTVSACSFNDHGCHAEAITVGGTGDHGACATFITLDTRGGLPTATPHVGACQRTDCSHNSNLMCSAEAVSVGWGEGEADCLTFSAS